MIKLIQFSLKKYFLSPPLQPSLPLFLSLMVKSQQQKPILPYIAYLSVLKEV